MVIAGRKNHRTSKQMETTDGMKFYGRWFNGTFTLYIGVLLLFIIHKVIILTLEQTQVAMVKSPNLFGPEICVNFISRYPPKRWFECRRVFQVSKFRTTTMGHCSS